MPPDNTGVSPDEAQNTETTAESQNTGTGQAPNPSSAGRDEFVSMGIKIERERMMKRFGVETLDDIDAALDAYRTQQSGPQPSDDAAPQDISRHPEYEKITREYGTIKRKYEDLERERQKLELQADEARLEKLRSSALSAGVGPGQQLEAFVRLYGDRVRFGPDRQLEVLSKLPDGSLVPMNESLDEFITGALQESKFLVSPEGRTGGGTRTSPASHESESRAPGDYDWREHADAFDIPKGSRSSKLDRLFGRAVGSKDNDDRK